MHALVGSVGCAAHVCLQHLCKLYASCQVLVLDEFEHDVALGRVGVESYVVLLVVFLEQYYGVLAFCHLQILYLCVRTTVAQGVCLESAHAVVALQCIGVYGYKEVGFLAVGYLGAFVQGYEHVGLAGIYHRHVGTVALHIASESERYAEVDVLFYRFASGCSGVLSAMSWVDAKRELAVGIGC